MQQLSSRIRLRFAPRPLVYKWWGSFVVWLLTLGSAFAQEGWSSGISLPTGRDLARAVAVGGRLYVIGGHNASGELGAVQSFDAATSAWKVQASMPTPRHQMAVGVINGIIYVAGGCCPTSNVLEAFDPRHNTWTTKALMPIATEPAGTVANGILYAIGGNAHGFCTNAVQAYNASTNTWALVSPMLTPRCHLAAVTVSGLIYAIGGTDTSGNLHLQTMEVYDPVSDRWSPAANMPTGRCLLAAAALDSKIYVLGGNNPEEPKEPRGPIDNYISNSVIFGPGSSKDHSPLRANLEVYDPSTKKWATGSPMPTARTGVAVAVLGSSLYAVGGNGMTAFLPTNETFRPQSSRSDAPSH